MKTCPTCGFHHTGLDERCIRCGAYLDTIGQPDRDGLPREAFNFKGGERPRWRWSLPSRVAAAARRRLYFIHRALESKLPVGVHYRNPWTAGILAIIPGLGQLYNHQPKKALLIVLFIAACLTLAVLTIHQPFSNYVLLGCLMAQVYGFHDALVTAKWINRDYLTWQHRLAFYFAWFLYISAFCIGFQYVAAHCLVQFRSSSLVFSIVTGCGW